MPNWKKLITSGSDTSLNSLSIATSITASIISASSGITGSLFGTSSWAQSASNAINAQTASFLPVGTYQITSSWAQSASNAINAQTASFLPVGTYQITSSWAVSASNSINARTSSNIFPAITNNTSSYVLTATGNGTINGNSNLTFDGSDLTLGSSTGIVLPSNGYVKGPQSTILLGGNATYNVSIPNDFVTATASFGSPFSTRIQLLTNVESIPGGYDSGSIFFKTPSGSGMTYTNEGRLGIGISNPTNTLQIQGNVSASSYTGSLFGTSSWAINALTASFVNTASTNAFVQNGNSFGTTALLGTNDTQDLQLETSGSVRMTISSSGNVGIGTTAPLTRLHISGANNDSLLRIQSPASASILFVTGSGNVGLGTLTPTATLEIASTGSATLGQAQIYLNTTAVGRNRIDFNTIGLGVPATTTRSDGTKITLYPAISATQTDIALGVAFPAGVGEFWSSVYASTISFSWYAAATQIMRLAGDGQLRLGAGSAALPVISAGLSGTDTNTGIYFPTADTIGLVTGGTERARITSAGSASIGTITSTPSATLHVSGANADNLFRVSSPSAANALFVSGSGNVGIGTTNPISRLQIAGGNIALDATRHIDWGSGNSRITDLGLTTGQGYPITISTFGPIGTGTSNNLTEKLRLTGSGSLGLGTTTPSARFHISGGFTDGNLMRVQSPTGAEYFFISASGNVGIGTNLPSADLHISGASADSLLLVGSPTNANILFITGSGNIGIGTTPTSSFRLDVSGSARFGSGSVGFASGLGQIHAVDRTGAYITATQTTSSIVTFMGADSNGGIVGTYSNNDFLIRSNNTDRILLQGINVGIQIPPAEWIHLSSDPGGSKYIQIDAAQASNNPPFYTPGGGNTVSRVWGNIGDDYVLGTPDYWIEIKLDGTVVLIPCYTPTP